MLRFNQLNDLNIAPKLVIICMITTVISLITASLTFVTYDRYNAKEVLRQEVTVLADIIANRSTATLAFSDTDLATKNLEALASHESILTACIYALYNDVPEVFAKYSANAVSCPELAELRKSRDGDMHFEPILSSDVKRNNHLFVMQYLTLDGEKIGLIYVDSTLDQVTEQVTNKILIALVAILIAGIIALLISKKLALFISTPLKQLRETAEQIANSDDYSLRAEKETNDEVGSVVDSFNYMLSVIDKEDKKLRESEEKFRLISTSSGIGIFQADTQGVLSYANQRLAEMSSGDWHVDIERFIDQTIHDEYKSKVLHHWHKLQDSGNELNQECRLIKTDAEGAEIWVSLNISALFNDDIQVGFLGSLTDISEIKRAQSQLERMAFYDPLTGLANRRLFKDRLAQLLSEIERTEFNVTLALLDLDDFKHINDALGHDVGDELLKVVGNRLELAVRKTDTVARIGGDEFAIILFNTANENALVALLNNILESLRIPLELGGHTINVTGSIGVALADNSGNDITVLTKRADLALYRAKDSGRNTYAFFSQDLDELVLERISIINDLNKALEAEEFSLVFQPKYDLRTMEITSFEALLRWIHPEKGFIGPDKFIPIAESTGQILDIGRWVIQESCRVLSELQLKQLIDNSVSVAINLSAKQFIDESLIQAIASSQAKYHLEPHQLEFEITETSVMENIEHAIDVMNTMKNLGLSISIDDFGTGYSSLSYLKKLPVDYIKIDRSFVMDIPEDLDDMAISAAVVAMAHELNFKVIAEGVETQEQLAFLQGCNCDFGQGYLMSRPLGVEPLIEHLSSLNNDKLDSHGT